MSESFALYPRRYDAAPWCTLINAMGTKMGAMGTTSEAADNPPSADDRFAMEDLLGRYFWAVDTADVEGVVAVFTDDAVVRYGDGQRYEGPDGIRRFALRAIGDQTARGRMHFNRPLFVERRGEALLMRSYLMVPQWLTRTDSVALGTLRYTEDLFVRTAGQWRIRERAIFLWNDQTAPRATHGKS